MTERHRYAAAIRRYDDSGRLFLGRFVLDVSLTSGGWGSKAEFLARYADHPLPDGSDIWTGEVEFLEPPSVGASLPLRTPFGDLTPTWPLYRRVAFMPRVRPYVPPPATIWD